MTEQQEIYYRYIRQPYEAGLDLVLPDADDWDYDIILGAIYAELDRRKGFVYILANSWRNLYKVGMTRKGVEERVRGVNSAGWLNAGGANAVLQYRTYSWKNGYTNI